MEYKKIGINGVKEVGVKLIARGSGVVNSNGIIDIAIDVKSKSDSKKIIKKIVKNHSVVKTDKSIINKYKKDNGNDDTCYAFELNLDELCPIISTNCLRNALFVDDKFIGNKVNRGNQKEFLVRNSGLFRGHCLTDLGVRRESPLKMTEFKGQKGVLRHEQFSKEGVKDSNSLHSKTTLGETDYVGYASIDVKLLSFISLDAKNDRGAYLVKEGEGVEYAKLLTERIRDIQGALGYNPELNPEATFHEKCVSFRAIGFGDSLDDEVAEEGIIINSDGVDVLVYYILGMLQALCIKRTSGYMNVTEMIVDYNDSNYNRIREDLKSISTERKSEYAVYVKAL